MVKKCLFALVAVVMLVTLAPAQTPGDGGPTPSPDDQPGNTVKRDGDWPWTYKAIDLCTMPVYMDVGHYVTLKECHKRELKLKQVDCSDIGKNVGDHFPCYSGCEEIEVKANFPAIFGGKLNKVGEGESILKDTKVYWEDDKDQITGSTGNWEKLTVCIDAWKAEIWKALKPDDKLKVGELVINVKPPDGGAS